MVWARLDEAQGETRVTVSFNDKAEQSVLGGLMMSPRYLPAVAERVRASDFYRPAHRRIFETIVSIAAEGLEPDPTTVADRLHDDEDVEALGGRLYITVDLPTGSLASRAPSTRTLSGGSQSNGDAQATYPVCSLISPVLSAGSYSWRSPSRPSQLSCGRFTPGSWTSLRRPRIWRCSARKSAQARPEPLTC